MRPLRSVTLPFAMSLQPSFTVITALSAISTSTYSGIITSAVTAISPNSVSSVLSPAFTASSTATLMSAYDFELLSIATAP